MKTPTQAEAVAVIREALWLAWVNSPRPLGDVSANVNKHNLWGVAMDRARHCSNRTELFVQKIAGRTIGFWAMWTQDGTIVCPHTDPADEYQPWRIKYGTWTDLYAEAARNMAVELT